MAQKSQVSYEQSKPLAENDFERIQKLRAEIEERQEKISIVPLTKDSTRRNSLGRSSGRSGVVNWADKVRAAITNLEAKTGRVLEPEQALALIDDIVEGRLAADELAMIHGISQESIKTTLDTSPGPLARAGSGRSTPAAGTNSSAMSNPTTWHPVSPPPGRRCVACPERSWAGRRP